MRLKHLIDRRVVYLLHCIPLVLEPEKVNCLCEIPRLGNGDSKHAEWSQDAAGLKPKEILTLFRLNRSTNFSLKLLTLHFNSVCWTYKQWLHSS